LALEKAKRQRAIAQTTLKLKQNETAAASEAVARRQITAPLAGVVAQVYKRQGEWVKPGDNVMRVLRVDRLRAEFFVPADSARADWRGRAVQFVVQHGDGPPRTFSGRVVFVSTEINKINNEVQVWAEIENRARSLRPGVEGTLTMP
jgi:RND family efflux transporter MFP subunit